jgi:membrane protein
MSKAKALFFTVPLKAARQWWTDDAPTLAAALAYYTVFSLAPLAVIALAMAGIVVGESTAREALVTQVRTLIGPDAASFLDQAVQKAAAEDQGRGLAALFGVVTLIIGATGVFGQLQASLNAIWGIKPKPRSTRGTVWQLLRTRLISFGMILAVGFLLLVSLVASMARNIVSNAIGNSIPGIAAAWTVADLVISLALVTLLFALIFKVLPDADISWRDVFAGALATAILFGIGKFLIGFYIGNSAVASTYGAAGSLIVILIWAWFSGLVLYYGAEYTQVYARNFGSKIEPASYAECVDQDRSRPDAEVNGEAAPGVPEEAWSPDVNVDKPSPARKSPIAAQRQAEEKKRRR